MLGSTEVAPAIKTASNGVLLVSGTVTAFLGPVRVDPFFNKTFQVYNQSFAPVTVNLQGNLDPHGREPGTYVGGSSAGVSPNPGYWQTIKSFTVQASGSAALVTDSTPLSWVQLTTAATIPNTTVSGFMLALANA